MEEADIRFMKRALDLATRGGRSVSPNPEVGCVIVSKSGQLLAEGWHQIYGGPHAEIVALNAIKDPVSLSGATVYVTLEPCAHYGKTPPCANALIEAGVGRVVVACQDPNPLVGGKGIKILRDAGIQVDTGVLEEEAIRINRQFFHSLESKMPYITLKWAETRDGYLAPPQRGGFKISNKLSGILVHQLRSRVDAVLVGQNTLLLDDPALNLRDWHGVQPARIAILTKPVSSEIVKSLQFFDGSLTTYVVWLSKTRVPWFPEHVKVLYPDPDLDHKQALNDVLIQLKQAGLNHILVEGGAATLNLFIKYELWHVAMVCYGAPLIGHGVKAPTLDQALINERFSLGDANGSGSGYDRWEFYQNRL